MQSSVSLPLMGIGDWVLPPTKKYEERFQCDNFSTDHWQQSSKLIPNYNQSSCHSFKHLLSTAIPTYCQQIQPYLADATTLQFLREHASVVCTFVQLNIESDYWKYIADLNMPVVVWLSELSKDIIRQNSINWDHTKTKMNIQYRQNLIRNKLKCVETDLNAHLLRCPSSLQIQHKISLESSREILFKALFVLIHNDLARFRGNFERKKILWKYDVDDAKLVKLFYDLNPTDEQVNLYPCDKSHIIIFSLS